MRRLVLIVVLTGAMFFVTPALAHHLGQGLIVPDAGVEGGDALVLPRGDILNVRNIQGGVVTRRRRDRNLDLGAGNSVHRGDVVVNWDVGECLKIYDGRMGSGQDGRDHIIAKFCPRGIVFYRRVIHR